MLPEIAFKKLCEDGSKKMATEATSGSLKHPFPASHRSEVTKFFLETAASSRLFSYIYEKQKSVL